MANPERRTRISDLPSDILNDSILGKLPLWAQRQAKPVCKDWKTRLSRCKTRAKEDWIIINCIDHLLWYNVDQNKWLKNPMSIASLPLPLQSPRRLCCVYQELLFFRDNANPPRICCWNAATDESKLLDIDPVPGKHILQFGAYTDEKTGELELLLYDYEENAETGRLFRCDVERGGAWNERPFTGPIGPNFNNLTPSNRVVTFTDFGEALHLYDIDRDSVESSSYASNDAHVVYHYEWEYPKVGGRFHFPKHGWFVIGPTKFQFMREGLMEEIGVLWYDMQRREFEMVSRVSHELARSMREECGGVLFLDRAVNRVTAGAYCFFFCSDGVENIWVLLPGCFRMLRLNVVSGDWFTLPSVLPKRQYDEGDDDPYVRALYTTL